MKFRPRRYVCRFDVEMSVPEGVRDACILDVTEKGARVEGLVGLTKGEAVRFEVLGQPVSARVAWRRGEVTGLIFDAPITPRQLDTVRKPAFSNNARGRGKTSRHVHSFREIA